MSVVHNPIFTLLHMCSYYSSSSLLNPINLVKQRGKHDSITISNTIPIWANCMSSLFIIRLNGAFLLV